MFSNKKILITGHTGFKGFWLSCILNYLNADIYGISIDIPTEPSIYKTAKANLFKEDIRLDVCNGKELTKHVVRIKPDFIFHLAAQPLVSVSYELPDETIKTNALGTVSILQAIRKLENNVVAILITSDKAYYNSEWVYGYRENDKLGGIDPYSASKAMAELAINSFHNSFFKKENTNVKIGIVRAGNVIGGGDWAKDRLVPDCIKAWTKKHTVIIRSPNATRPWQHVLEPLSGYITLALKLANNNVKSGEAYNFGPSATQNRTVLDMLLEMKKHLKTASWELPKEERNPFYEAGLLKLNCDKALVELEWNPTLNFEETVSMTVEWYKHYYFVDKKNISDITINQIESYFSIAKKQNLKWAQLIRN